MIQENFICKRDGLSIKGIICRSEDSTNKKSPAIIMSHGFTGNMYGNVPYFESFCREGYVGVTFSFCGGGRTDDPEEIRSDGNTYDMTISSEVADLIAVVEYTCGLDYVDSENIVLLGESQGGFVSGLAAARLQDRIKKLVMIFPAICIPDHARRGIMGGAKYDPSEVPEKMNVGVTVIGKKLHDDVVNMDPFLELEKYKGPVLIIHGDADGIVNVSYSVRARKAYKEGQCSLQIVRNMGHGFDSSQRESVIASVRQFLADKKEIMAFRIVITHVEHRTENDIKYADVFFTGYCESELFTGTILPGGVDRQRYAGDEPVVMEATYTFDGIDSEGTRCSLSVVNKWGGADWKPEITTDSEALKWLNGADLTAVLEHGAGGPTVRIFA